MASPVQVKLTLTHEEIAEIIGTTRETVSRLFSQFKKKQLLQLKGATLTIRNPSRPAKNGQLVAGAIAYNHLARMAFRFVIDETVRVTFWPMESTVSAQGKSR
jgi:ribosomal protein S3